MFQLTQPSGYFQRTLFFIPKSLYGVFLVHAGHTRVCLGLGSQAQPWGSHAGTLTRATRKTGDRCAAWPCSSRGGASQTWVLTSWRSSALAEPLEALGTLQKMEGCIYGVWWVTSQQLKAQPSWRWKWASHEPLTARPCNYRISNVKYSHDGGCGDLWCLTEGVGI